MLISQVVGNLTVPINVTDSNIINYTQLGDSENFIIQAPAVLAEVPTIYVSSDGITYAQLMDSSGTAVKAPAAGTAMSYRSITLGAAMYLKIVLGGNAAAARTFILTKQSRI